MSTARHPQTDGQTERVNLCLETFLRCFVHACPTKWYAWLPLAEFWYNTSPHSALGTTPFEVLYGHAPRHFGIVDPVACASPDLAEWLQDRAQMTALIRQHLLRARQNMKDSADKRRSHRVFEVGDWVFLKLQPYVQRSVATRSNQKLAFRYFSPYKVLHRVGAVAYKLQMPEDSTVHPVFHVSRLWQALPPMEQALQQLPRTASPTPVPEEI
uniref:Integrase catalytic domain-containing protein n=1 Tax=Triticum urartu TaxID=4572 RepID=A0A8R7PYZ4_TRIUA